jgi:hypothetical protein
MPQAVYAKINEEQFRVLMRGEAVEIESVAGPKVVLVLADIRGGTDIRGPSIRLAEAIAERWGDIKDRA